ncbi:MAG: indole-3-glycerol phosphate synthase TrpC [Methanoculleus sp.]
MIIDDILRSTRERVAAIPVDLHQNHTVPDRSLADAIRSCTDRIAVIAEVKYASPSGGRTACTAPPEALAAGFATAGAVGVSVLTEPSFFGGSTENLIRARAAIPLSVLRKDFIIDERQVAETRAMGADAILLIARVLGDDLPRFVDSAHEAGLEALVEVRNHDEVEAALATGTDLVGINNRDLRTFKVNLSTTRRLSGLIRDDGRLVVSESGILWPYDVRSLRDCCDAFLIGSAIMNARNPERRLEGFVFA